MKTERFDKKLFKQEVLNNLKTQFRVELNNASQQQIYQAVAYALKSGSLRTGWILRRPTKRKTQRFYIICPWNS